MVRCITNKKGFSVLVADVEVSSGTVEPLSITAVIDTGASVSLMSPDLAKRIEAQPTKETTIVHGAGGAMRKPLLRYSITAGGLTMETRAIALDGRFMGYDLALGLDVLLETGLTLTPGGEHRFGAPDVR